MKKFFYNKDTKKIIFVLSWSAFVLLTTAGDFDCDSIPGPGSAPTPPLFVASDSKLVTAYINGEPSIVNVIVYRRSGIAKDITFMTKSDGTSLESIGVNSLPDTIDVSDFLRSGVGFNYDTTLGRYEMEFSLVASDLNYIGEHKITVIREKTNNFIETDEFTLRIVPAGEDDPLTLNVTPKFLYVNHDETGNAEARITRTSLIQEAVTLSIDNLPNGVTATFTPNPLSFVDVVSQLEFFVAGNVQPRNYSIIVRASASGFNALDTIDLVVVGPWNYQSLSDFSLLLSSVAFSNQNIGVAVGFGGKTYYSVDGGVDWNNVSSGTTQHLSSVAAVNQNNFIAVGNNKTVLKSSNSGQSWELVQSVPGDNNFLNGVSFVPNTLFGAVMSNDNIIWTTNGGSNWVLRTSPGSSLQTNILLNGGISLFDGSKALITGQVTGGGSPVIIRTTNGGASWMMTQVPTVVRGVTWINNTSAIAVGNDSRIFRSNDGGLNWVVINSPIENSTFNSVSFYNENIGTIVGVQSSPTARRVILRTTDGGQTWNEEFAYGADGLPSINLSDVHMISEEEAFAVGGNRIYKRK